MNTVDVNEPEPSIEGDSCYILRATAHGDVEERECSNEEVQADQFGPEEDFDEWLAHRGPEEPPEPGDKDMSPQESNELLIRGIRAFAPPIAAAEGRARLLRSRQLRLRERHLRVREARQASRRLATDRARHRVARARPRSRATRRTRPHRATAARNAASEGGPAPASAPSRVKTLAAAQRTLPAHLCTEGVGHGQ